jgi:hypothetical protein
MKVKNNIHLNHQVKRNQALLESNLQGIHLKNDKNVKSMGHQSDSPLIFLEFIMPKKTRQSKI